MSVTERRTPTVQVARTVRAGKGGRITIPAEFRKALGIAEDSVLEMTLTGDELRMKPVRDGERPVGSPWLKDLYDYLEPAREEAIAKGYTEEEINEAIDQAVAAVRAKHG